MAQFLKAVEAIEFALTIDDHFEMREFLKSWAHGDIDEWEADFEAWKGRQCPAP